MDLFCVIFNTKLTFLCYYFFICHLTLAYFDAMLVFGGDYILQSFVRLLMGNEELKVIRSLLIFYFSLLGLNLSVWR